jgi:hypothetical protein
MGYIDIRSREWLLDKGEEVRWMAVVDGEGELHVGLRRGV